MVWRIQLHLAVDGVVPDGFDEVCEGNLRGRDMPHVLLRPLPGILHETVCCAVKIM